MIKNKNFIRFAKERKTTYEFSEKKIKEEDLKKILEAGRWAPSLRNSQPWHFIVIKNKEKIAHLISKTYYGEFHTEPPLLIAIVGINKKDITLAPFFRGTEPCLYDVYISVGMACLNMIYEAEDIGVGSCILTPKEEDVKKIMRIPNFKSLMLPILLGIGYKKQGAFQKKRERNQLSTMVSYEYFGGKRAKYSERTNLS